MTAYAYDALGRVTSVTVGAGTALARTTKTIYNPDNTIAQAIQNYKDGVFTPTRPDEDIITSYGYDRLGRTVAVTDTLGLVTATHYNAAGQVDWTARNLAPAQFDSQRQPIFQGYSPGRPDANIATLYGYDGLGRATLVTETGILTGTFNITTLQFSNATTRTTRTEYDALSRPITVTLNYRPGLPSSADTNIQLYTRYDGAGNVIAQTDALGRWTTTRYDALNRPITVTLNYQDGNPLTGPSDADIVTATRYDSAGRAAQTIENYVDGVVDATQPITDHVTLYSYDSLNRVTATTVNAASGRSGAETISYRYDGLLRLIGATWNPGTSYSYAHDAVGNRTDAFVNGIPSEPHHLYDAANQIAFNSYDRAGNLVGDGTWSYTYDALNRVTQATGLGQTQQYTYNGDGVLMAQAIAGSSTRYVQDLAAPLSQVLQSTPQFGTTTSYLYGRTRLAAQNGTTKTWYAGDALGSVRRTLSSAGVPGAPISYNPWGTPECDTTPPAFGFTGELRARSSDLVYPRARWYYAGYNNRKS